VVLNNLLLLVIVSTLVNALQEIDVEVFEVLSRLRVLNLRDNRLTSLPEEISCFQLLVQLDLTNNCLTM
jgi:Leucine-rich repeat (LRR) protein